MKMSISLPAEKENHIFQVAQEMMQQRYVTTRQLASFIGVAMSSRVAVLESTLHLRNLQRDLNFYQKVLPKRNFYNQKIQISEMGREDLAWWRDTLNHHTENKILPPPVDFQVYSDASSRAWGAM